MANVKSCFEGEETDQQGEVTDHQRRVLLLSLIIGFGATLLGIVPAVFSFLTPTRKKNSYGGKIDAGPLAYLPPKGSAPLRNPRGQFWIVHTDEGLSAVHSSCTHLECKFNWDDQKQLFVCPCHGSEFDRAGAALNGPAPRSLDSFPIELVTDDELVRRSDSTGNPLPIRDLLEAGDGQENTKDSATIHIIVDTGQKISGARKPA